MAVASRDAAAQGQLPRPAGRRLVEAEVDSPVVAVVRRHTAAVTAVRPAAVKVAVPNTAPLGLVMA